MLKNIYNYYWGEYYERILTEEINIDDLYNAIEKLVIVEIELKNGEDVLICFNNGNLL